MIGQVFLPPEAAERSAVLQANEERQARRDREDAKGRDTTRGLRAMGALKVHGKAFSSVASSVYLLYSFLRFKPSRI